MDLKELGFTREEIEEKLLARVSRDILKELRVDVDEDGETKEYYAKSTFAKTLVEYLQSHLDSKVEEVAEKYLLPQIIGKAEALVLQPTNKWGEKQGEPTTLTEYMVKQAEKYITEKVDYNGKSKEENRGYSFEGKQTRIAHMINRHLHYTIENAVKKALGDANSILTKGIEETVKIQLEEVSKKLKIGVKTK